MAWVGEWRWSIAQNLKINLEGYGKVRTHQVIAVGEIINFRNNPLVAAAGVEAVHRVRTVGVASLFGGFGKLRSTAGWKLLRWIRINDLSIQNRGLHIYSRKFFKTKVPYLAQSNERDTVASSKILP